MKTPNLRTKALIIATGFALLVGGLSLYVSYSIQKSKELIIEVNTAISKQALNEFSVQIQDVIETVWFDELKGREAITRREERQADATLSAAIEAILEHYEGAEGGIYFALLDEFIGYSYPSIPAPKPVFGPPPRSYNIIRDQVLESISRQKTIIELHGFDPAIFPLVTTPVFIDGEPVAALWTRVHIARELAATGNVTRALINMTLIVTLLGFIIAFAVSWKLKQNLEEIRDGLDLIKQNNTYRLPERKGLPGFISHYINDMITALFDEQQKRHHLERELHQKEKMATLGKMIAGAAHEINTPISIIKTRIQIWERHLKKSDNNPSNTPFSTEAMQLVRHEIDRVSELVKRLLIFSRPVSARKSVANLLDIINDRVQTLENTYMNSDIHFSIKADDELFPVFCDKNAIEQVLVNLINNSIEADATSIDITVNKQDMLILTHLTDNGNGISEETMKQIFDPFFTTKSEGTGLGTSIAFEIMRSHNGRIDYAKGSNGGTICTLEFPLHLEEEPLIHA